MRLAMEHAPSSQKSNAQRVRELHEQGLHLKSASSHGVNNCLIDALLLGLLDVGLVPGTISLSQQQRRHLCAACRYFLYTEHGTPAKIYLDAHHDAPRILDFFCGRNGHRMLLCAFGCIVVLITLTSAWKTMPCGGLIFNLSPELR